MKARRGARWNHNIHLHGIVMKAIPSPARSALDVGTGDGLLATDLRAVLPDVTAVDVDADVLARAAAEHPDVSWIRGDIMTLDLGRSFDVVASVATLHHLGEPAVALAKLRDLTAPGGVLVIIGVARAASLKDHLMGIVGVVQHQWYSRTRNYWEHSAPTLWPPPHTYTEIRERAASVLPGATWRQHPLWRYSLIWRKPR